MDYNIAIVATIHLGATTFRVSIHQNRLYIVQFPLLIQLLYPCRLHLPPLYSHGILLSPHHFHLLYRIPQTSTQCYIQIFLLHYQRIISSSKSCLVLLSQNALSRKILYHSLLTMTSGEEWWKLLESFA